MHTDMHVRGKSLRFSAPPPQPVPLVVHVGSQIFLARFLAQRAPAVTHQGRRLRMRVL